jgi:hypothetical protein
MAGVPVKMLKGPEASAYPSGVALDEVYSSFATDPTRGLSDWGRAFGPPPAFIRVCLQASASA